jgi:hypothetical protein
MDIGPDTPLRLDTAAKMGFPDGGMSPAGLRRESKRGRLVIFRVAGKDYTTLKHIGEMVEQCRVQQVNRDSGCAKPVLTKTANIPPSGLSSMAVGRSALDAAVTTLTVRSER